LLYLFTIIITTFRTPHIEQIAILVDMGNPKSKRGKVEKANDNLWSWNRGAIHTVLQPDERL